MSTSATTNDLLAGPPPRITRTDIDFAQTELSGYAGLYAVLLDNVLTPAECAALIGAAEATTNGVWEKALINVGNGKQRAAPEARNSDRIIWDDADMVERLWRRVEPWVPELKVLGPGCPAIRPAKPGKEQWWRATRYFHSLRDEGVLTTMAIRLNERMRILRYGPGEYFRPHCDGSYATPDAREVSYYTLHLYLNNSSVYSPDSDLKGGATTFHDFSMKKTLNVHPKMGRVLIFQHRGLLHSGDDVTAGTKFTMRTDLMYERTGRPGGQ